MKFDLIFSSFDIQIPSKKVVNAETRRWWKYIGANFWGSGTNFTMLVHKVFGVQT